MKHYETLGIDQTATADQIKRAYRAKAKDAHPDKGGKQSDFEPIVQAYEVLKDPARRLLYDNTGQDKQEPIETAAQALLLQLFNQAVAVEDDIPVVRTVRAQIELGAAKIPESIKQLKARQKKLEAKRKTVKSKGPTNIVHMIIDHHLKGIAGQIMNLEREAKVDKACLKALDKYTEDWEPPQPPPIQFIQWNAADPFISTNTPR